MIRTPAGTDLPGCGVVIASFKQPACVAIALEKTFMVQSCCGDACDDLGSKRIRGVGPLGARSLALRGLGGYLLKDADGNVIEPAEIGAPPPEEKRARGLAGPAKQLFKRDCEKDSWQGGDVLTKPANNVQIVSDSVVGPGQVTVTKGRSQSWSTSISGGLSFADIFNMGVSADMTEEESSSKSVTVTIPEGQSGKLGFTATLSCRSGSGRCNGGEVEGEVCCECTTVWRWGRWITNLYQGRRRMGTGMLRERTGSLSRLRSEAILEPGGDGRSWSG